MMTTGEFLTSLWGKLPQGRVLIWTLPDKKSRWYVHFENVTGDMRFHESEDVYTGVGLAPKDALRLPSSKRLKEWEVAGIAAFWADIDVAHPVHKKSEHLPPSIERALEVIAELPFTPTIVVDSGHGLQLWWALDEPWLFQDDEDRELARRACQWWHRTVKDLFKAHGWTVDSTFDLARVMRLPGTWNNKEAQDRKRVEVLENPGPRYGKQQFIELIPGDFQATPMGVRRSRSANGSGFTPGSSGLALDPEAEPSSTRMEALLKLEPRFRATWEKQRPELSDQSPSAYDMALANHAVRAKWPDQEVANLLIAFRRRHGLDLKLRENYYAVTIAKAKEPYPNPTSDNGRANDDPSATGSGPSAEEIPHRRTVDPTAETSQPEEPAGKSTSYDGTTEDLRQKVVLTRDEGRNVKVCVEAILLANREPTLFALPEEQSICVLFGKDIRICSPAQTHLEVSRRCRFVRFDKNGKEQNGTPTVTLMNLVHLALQQELPVLNGIKRMPFVWNGSLVTQPGYHSPSGYWMHLPQDIDLTLSVVESLDILDDYFGEFPFNTPADKTNAYSMAICAPLKTFGNGPGYLFTKPVPQTGATLLASCLARIMDERKPYILTQGKTPGELDKRVVTKLKKIPSVLIVDNLTQVLDSEMIASGMTDETFGSRLLQVNEDLVIPTAALTIAFTGNNFVVTHDFLTRCIGCRLDANMSNPENRVDFRHQLPHDVIKDRPRLVSAVASIVQRWLEAGMPKGRPTLGAFIPFLQAASGLMEFAGLRGFDSNRATIAGVSTASWDTIDTIIYTWWEKHGSSPMSSVQLVPLAQDLDLKGFDPQSQARSLTPKIQAAMSKVFEIDEDTKVKIEERGRDDQGRAKRGLRYRLKRL